MTAAALTRLRRLAPPLLLVLLGTALLRITVGSDVYLRYVKEELRLPLVASGVILLGLGVAGAATRLAPHGGGHRDHDHGHDHGHAHGHGPGVAWLLALPAVLLLCLTPPALGSFTASRADTDAAVDPGAYPTSPLADLPTPLPLSLGEFIARSRDPRHTLAGHPVRLTGFVTPGTAPGEWYLNRLVAHCCAADARRLRVLVHADGPTPATDSWVELTGVWHPTPAAPATTPPRLDATARHPAPHPRTPYRDTPPPPA
ncbi:TIGR03943 family protein [Kitasatospora sp. NPDC001527]|uniref:TIGR03943 family putative permease subunit n=1 Tax=Kitasatospora sp. NPDC001527 TaxID=3154519 RepID=UPI003323AF54